MRALFLAVGATRRPVMLKEAAIATAEGKSAVIVLDRISRWAGERFPAGVEIVDLSTLESYGRALSTVELLAVKAPRRLFRKLKANKLGKSYDVRMLAVLNAMYTKLEPRRLAKRQQILQKMLRDTPADLLVIGDPASMVHAADLVDAFPNLRYGYDYQAVSQ